MFVKPYSGNSPNGSRTDLNIGAFPGSLQEKAEVSAVTVAFWLRIAALILMATIDAAGSIEH